jgi:hypothetical protein
MFGLDLLAQTLWSDYQKAKREENTLGGRLEKLEKEIGFYGKGEASEEQLEEYFKSKVEDIQGQEVEGITLTAEDAEFIIIATLAEDFNEVYGSVNKEKNVNRLKKEIREANAVIGLEEKYKVFSLQDNHNPEVIARMIAHIAVWKNDDFEDLYRKYVKAKKEGSKGDVAKVRQEIDEELKKYGNSLFERITEKKESLERKLEERQKEV